MNRPIPDRTNARWETTFNSKAVRSRRTLRPAIGFALIELAIVIAIVSLFLGAGLALFNSQIDNQRTRTTTDRASSIQSALADFVARNGRLPCPARPNVAPGAVGYGVEDAPLAATAGPPPTPPACPNVTSIASGVAFQGVVPWTTLGIPNTSALDGWSRRYTYIVSVSGIFEPATGQVRNLSSQVATMRGNITLHNATPVAFGLPNVGNQINACSTTAGDMSCNGEAIVALISHGNNGLGAFQDNGVRIAVPAAGSREEENTNNNLALLQMDLFDSDDGNHFDDLVLALSTRNLVANLTTTNQMKSERLLLNESFDAVMNEVISKAIAKKNDPTLCSGVPNCYPIPATILAVDPWGQSFAYSQVTPYIAASSVSGVAYTIQSAGGDLVNGTADDIPPVSVFNIDLKAIFAKTGL